MSVRFKSLADFTRPVVSWAGLCICLMTLLIVIYNVYSSVSTLAPAYRTTISALLFIIALTLTTFNKKLGLVVCIFLLPLLPTLTFQILSYTGYGRILHQESSGLDLISGFVCGCIINQYIISRKNNTDPLLPWPAGLLLIFITISAFTAIFRNLSQTESPINFYGFLYSLAQYKTLDWHDDFRPLFDWIAYGIAMAAFAYALPILKSSVNRNDIVFKPLIVSLLIASVVGLIQNRLGIGLTPSQLQFRSARMSSGYDFTGFTSVGFQPDIHSYAGVLMIGAIGLLGYWYYSNNKSSRYLIPIAVMPLSLLAMLASKSKSSIALTVLFLIISLCIWHFKRSPYLKKILIGIGIAICVICTSFYFFQNAWTYIFTSLAHRLGFADLYAMNFSMAFRPEIFIAAFRMFAEFPLMGLGQGDFYRLSAMPEFSYSPFLTVTLNGENSHNYFIQVLAENGLIGFGLFCLFIFYPIAFIKNKKLILPATIGLCSLFLGNLYSHSLLVRENLLLCAFFLALMYAWLDTNIHTATSIEPAIGLKRWLGVLLMLAICMASYLAYKEIRKSFRKFPFTEDYQCFKEKPLTQDGWTSGLFKINLERGVSGTNISIKASQPNPHLIVVSQIVHPQFGIVSAQETQLSADNKDRIVINMPEGLPTADDQYQIILKLQRCYIPKNWGISNDPRRLGLQIDSIKMIRH